jgi:predicted phosphodiesterase
MRVKSYSDLHLEFSKQPPIDVDDADVGLLILAGDIHTKGRGVAGAQNTFTSRMAVSGNHEFHSSVGLWAYA